MLFDNKQYQFRVNRTKMLYIDIKIYKLYKLKTFKTIVNNRVFIFEIYNTLNIVTK